jgi:uncharacterized protein
MKKNISLIFLVIIVSLAGTFWLFRREKTAIPNLSTAGNNIKEIKINGYVFSVEIADTSVKRESGLSGRSKLCPQCAMLFLFEKPGNFSFWMKDMRFDLDMVWISGDEIVDISKNVSHARGGAEVVRPPVPVSKVLEINAGTSEKLDLKVGDKIEF